MQAYLEGTIKLLNRGERWLDYNDKAKGKVPVYTAFIQTEDGEVVQLNTTEDMSKLVDIPAVFTISVGQFSSEKGKWWVKLVKAVSAK